MKKVDKLGRIVIPLSLRKKYGLTEGADVEFLDGGDGVGKRKLSEPALKLNFSALSALITLAKYSLGGERQAPKSS